MRYQPLPAKFHTANRQKLRSAMDDDSIAIIDTADVLARGDNEYPFHPDSNFYYLTGIAEPEAVLVLVPSHPDPAFREILFLSGTTDHVSLWEGDRLTPAAAAKLSGIAAVLPLSEVDFYLDRLLGRYQKVYLNTDESLSSPLTSPSLRRAATIRAKMPLHSLRPATPILSELRTIKDKVEIEQIRRAVKVTQSGLRQAFAKLRPGMHEYEVEAALTSGYISGGAEGHGFNPIVASGRNATVIHYFKNDGTVGESDLVQFDTGAEVGWYSADISRVIPASGHFTPRQRAIYEAVYKTQQSAIAKSRPGESVLSINNFMQQSLLEELVKLGLVNRRDADSRSWHEHLAKFYPHISHHMGLDVHDTGSPRAEFKPGMVVTCEPGLYIKEEGIGVRIEDDILITESEPIVLSDGISADPDAIESLIQESR